MTIYTPILPTNGTSNPRDIAMAVNAALAGRTNNGGQVALQANATSTIIQDPRIGPQSKLFFMALSANAALAQKDLYVASVGKGEAIIHHSDNAQTDRSFNLLIIG